MRQDRANGFKKTTAASFACEACSPNKRIKKRSGGRSRKTRHSRLSLALAASDAGHKKECDTVARSCPRAGQSRNKCISCSPNKGRGHQAGILITPHTLSCHHACWERTAEVSNTHRGKPFANPHTAMGPALFGKLEVFGFSRSVKDIEFPTKNNCRPYVPKLGVPSYRAGNFVFCSFCWRARGFLGFLGKV